MYFRITITHLYLKYLRSVPSKATTASILGSLFGHLPLIALR